MQFGEVVRPLILKIIDQYMGNAQSIGHKMKTGKKMLSFKYSGKESKLLTLVPQLPEAVITHNSSMHSIISTKHMNAILVNLRSHKYMINLTEDHEAKGHSLELKKT